MTRVDLFDPATLEGLPLGESELWEAFFRYGIACAVGRVHVIRGLFAADTIMLHEADPSGHFIEGLRATLIARGFYIKIAGVR